MTVHKMYISDDAEGIGIMYMTGHDLLQYGEAFLNELLRLVRHRSMLKMICKQVALVFFHDFTIFFSKLIRS